MHKTSVVMHNSTFSIEERRTKVRMLLARSMTEWECARELGVDQATISRDKRAIEEMSKHFIYDLAKGQIAYEYQRSLDTLEAVQRESWLLYSKEDISVKEKLMALKRIVESVESKAKLLNEGPAVLTMQTMEARLTEVENEE